MTSTRATFRQSSVKQLVAGLAGRSNLEPSYTFSNGRSFNRRCPAQGEINPSVLIGDTESGYVIGTEPVIVPEVHYTDFDHYTDRDHYADTAAYIPPSYVPGVEPVPSDVRYTGPENYTEAENYY